MKNTNFVIAWASISKGFSAVWLSAKNNFFNTLMIFNDMHMEIIKSTFKLKYLLSNW
ncbi:hypothetical protein [Mesoplasma corruscae]|uniref:Uncharacterized protein n=1 Tax=Mesoplasma corruscae TaxID=216874 RepID=A0A2S5RHT2_9MOLU|nr:hypothetical protein [Mesoplasma corruscae]PPE06838.1 hypothetical protein MCORR_v1c04690 [Mesoplasma corruscae]